MRNQKYLLIFILFALVIVSSLPAEPLTSGQEPIVTKHYTLCLLSGHEIHRDTLRQFAKLNTEIESTVTKAKRQGVKLVDPVHVRLVLDYSFLCRDLWLASGVEPTAELLDEMREEARLNFATINMEELSERRQEQRAKYPFLLGMPGPFATDDSDFDMLEGSWLELEVEMADEQIDDLRNSLDIPYDQLEELLYNISKNACFSPLNNTIWIPHDEDKNIHRSFDTVTHEVGHWVFSEMCDEIIGRVRPSENWSPIKRALAAKSLLALNEFFADYTAVSNGNNMNISIHNYGKLPDEFKRVFSKKRTLEDFLAAAEAAGEDAYYFEEGHNSLNPSRSFVWKLKLALNQQKTDDLVYAAVRKYIEHFFKVEIDEYEHKEDNYFEMGAFWVEDYPQDIMSENMRLLRYLRAAADEQLSNEERQLFDEIGRKIYGRHFDSEERVD